MTKSNILLIILLLFSLLFRVVNLENFPAGLNADEAAIGYNAWSLIQTGKDEHGVSWPSVFRSFDDYKPAVYFYLVLPFVYFLGLTVEAVRLPSAILGTLSVWFVYQLALLFYKQKKIPSLLVTLIFSLSPWALHFSRGGWEVNAALTFILAGIYFFFQSFKTPKLFFLFPIFFSLSLYTYHSARIISPLLALTLIALFAKKLIRIHKTSKAIIFGLVLGVLVSLPLASQMLSKEGQSRFSGVSVFSDSGPLWQALELRRSHDNQLYTRLVHNKYLSYSLRFIENYLSHLSPRFLFITGDEIARSKVPGTGQFFSFLAPFYLFGIYYLLKQKTKLSRFILVWFFVSPLAASLTFQSPHALRSHNMVVPVSFVIISGFWGLVSSLKHRWFTVSSFVLLTLYFFAVYLHNYYYVYPRQLPYAWQYGFDQIANFVKNNGDNYDKIVITDRYDQPYILLAFFLQYPPEKMQQNIVMTPRDKFGFSTVRKLEKYEFKTINFAEDIKTKNTLIISADEPVDDKYLIDTIKDPAGNIMYKILTNEKE